MKRRSVEILAVAVVLFVCTSPVLATIHFKDGGVHDIDYRIDDDVWVDYESPGLGTTLNILDGVFIPARYHVRAWEDSIISILGGSINQLYAYDSSQVDVSGGKIGSGREGGIFADDSSQLAVSGGSMRWLGAGGSSQVAVSGGGMYNLRAYDSGQAAISGGSVTWLYAYNISQVTVSGGSVWNLWAHDSSQVDVSGGLIGGELLVSDNAILTIHGWDFAVDGMSVGYTELYSILGGDERNESYRQLTGTLLSGDPLNNNFLIGYDAKIVLVPEPATLLLLGLCGLALLRRRRHEVF